MLHVKYCISPILNLNGMELIYLLYIIDETINNIEKSIKVIHPSVLYSRLSYHNQRKLTTQEYPIDIGQ